MSKHEAMNHHHLPRLDLGAKLLAVACVAAILHGCNSASDNATSTPAASYPQEVTMEQAQRRISYKIILPHSSSAKYNLEKVEQSEIKAGEYVEYWTYLTFAVSTTQKLLLVLVPQSEFGHFTYSPKEYNVYDSTNKHSESIKMYSEEVRIRGVEATFTSYRDASGRQDNVLFWDEISSRTGVAIRSDLSKDDILYIANSLR